MIIKSACFGAAAVAVNGVIMVAKAITWWITGSG